MTNEDNWWRKYTMQHLNSRHRMEELPWGWGAECDECVAEEQTPYEKLKGAISSSVGKVLLLMLGIVASFLVRKALRESKKV